MASRDLKDLSPEMQKKVELFISMAASAGIDVLIYCTFRRQAEQLELFAQGRTKPGKVVTWTRSGKHNVVDTFGKPASRAFDCVPLVCGKPAWDRKDLYLELAKIGRKCGLRWGADWDGDGEPFERGEYDSPHFELP